MKDYTSVSKRTWSHKNEISLKEGEAAIVTRPDGSIVLHIPGDMEEVSLGHTHAMLMSLALSGTPLTEPIYRALCKAQGVSLDLVSAGESEGDLPN